MIQKKVGGDKDIIEASALLHDIGKAKLLAPGHEGISAQLAEKFLGKIKFNKNKISRVIECIRYENFENLEAKILSDADKLDVSGAIGVVRSCCWIGENKAKIYSNAPLLKYIAGEQREKRGKGRRGEAPLAVFTFSDFFLGFFSLIGGLNLVE